MARSPVPPRLILLLEDRWARLIHPDGTILEVLPNLTAEPEARLLWLERLKGRIAPRTPVLLVLGQVSVVCQEVPFLSPREQREAAERLAAGEWGGEPFQVGTTLLTDGHAEGGHQLWVAVQRAADQEAWLAVMKSLQAEPVLAVPLVYLLGRAVAALAPQAQDRLLVSLERDSGHLQFFRGEGLVFTRTFRLPEGLDPAELAEGDEELLVEVLSEELNRVLQFIKQKHRGVHLEAIHVTGLSAISAPHQSALEKALRLRLERVEEAFLPLVLRQLELERHRKGAFNLVPEEVLEARRIRWLRAVAWGAAAGMLVFCIAVWAVLAALERNKRQELHRAIVQRDQRRAIFLARDKALRERFPHVRITMAQEQAVRSGEVLERLALRLLEVPEGIQLHKVDISQVSGPQPTWRFTVSGSALSGMAFSVGPVAAYMAELQRFQGLQLRPLAEVSISDRRLADGQERLDQRAVTRFNLEGTLR